LANRLIARLSTSWVEQEDALEVYAVLTTLWKYDPTSVKGEWLAAAVKRLIMSETTVGGPYHMDNTLTVATNAQVASFINAVAKPLPNLGHFLDKAIADRRFHDTRLTDLGLLCLLVRACGHEGLAAYVEANCHQASWQKPLYLAIASMIRTPSSQVDQALLALCQRQRLSGLWTGRPLVRGVRKNHLSDVVTTALIAEILDSHIGVRPTATFGHLRQKRQDVAVEATKMFTSRPEPLRSSALAAIGRVCRADTNFEITQLPRFFAAALTTPGHLADSCYTTLGLANLYVWVAYTIYDDFIDNEGKPAELPVANIAMRASLDCFRSVLPDNSRYQQYVSDTFAGMDEANAWEVACCRFEVQGDQVMIAELPRYGKCTVLAERAFAHALTPMAILASHPNGLYKNSRHIEIAMRHYLIARQLNDDLHDWAKDMRVGQASYVVTAILRDMKVKQGTHNLDTLLREMQKRFRRKTMPKVCQCMLRHISLSRRHFAASGLLQATNDVYVLLDNLELSARHSLDIRAKGRALTGISPRGSVHR
jgi:hypothetical protein